MRRLALVLLAIGCQREAPPAPAGTADDCAKVAERVQQATQAGNVGNDAKVLIARMLPAMKVSCVEDHWPKTLTDCIVAAAPGDLKALTGCNQLMGKELQDKLQQRMLKTAAPRTP